MRKTAMMEMAVGLAVCFLTADVSAMYHPGVGRWMQRDPEGYVDGANVYQYGAGRPSGAADWLGTASAPPGPPAHSQALNTDAPDGLIIIIINNMILDASLVGEQRNMPCGEIVPTAASNVAVSLTWTHLERPLPGRWGATMGCNPWKRSNEQIAQMITDKITATSDAGLGLRVECPDGQECRNTISFDGRYRVVVAISLTIKNVWHVPVCRVSGQISGTLTAEGEIGVCCPAN